MTITIAEYVRTLDDAKRILGRGDNTAASLLEDTLRDSGYPLLADLLKLDDDTLPKSILVAYNHDPYKIKYIAANYSEEILALDNKYVNSDSLTNEQVKIILEFEECEPLETIDLSLYSQLVTIGWVQWQ